MSGDPTPYLNLITSEHSDKPNFIASLSAVLQPLVDVQVTIQSLPSAFDIDNAVGAQLDIIGQWVGRNRYLLEPLSNVYFSFDTPGLGFDQGTWIGPYDPTSGLVALNDSAYRTLLYAVIGANQWDGTVPSAYAIWETLFNGENYGVLIQDCGGMTMTWALTGNTPDAVTTALFEGGYLSLKPAGVRIDYYMTPGVANSPYFGFDIENSSISGFDVGAWGALAPGV